MADDVESIGAQAGPLRPDWGEDWAELECVTCGAGWVGPIGEHCSYCVLRIERTREQQRDLLRRPELPDRDDLHRPHAIDAWIDRLAVAVQAGIVDEYEARAWVEREGTR